MEHRAEFYAQMVKELTALRNKTRNRKSKYYKYKLANRPNLTSDVLWHRMFPDLMPRFSDVQFYDYTKNPHTMKEYLEGKLPPNYHLTFSYSPGKEWEWVLQQGGNVAMCFDKLPETYKGYTVVDGDVDDLTFTRPKGVIFGLPPKGKAKQDTSGFVIRGAA